MSRRPPDIAGGQGRARRPRRPAELTLLRPIPGRTAVHRLWAGTKLCLVVVLGLALGLNPTWPALGGGAAVVAFALVLARIPRGAWPRLPRWLWVGVVIGAALTLRSHAKPIGHLGGVALSWGGLEDFARIAVLGLTVFAAAAMVSWTTPMAEVAPALAALGTPLRWLRVPVDEWVATVALSIRCFPLLIDELRTLRAARRLRPTVAERKDSPVNRLDRLIEGFQDILMTAMTVSLRRAGELGEAIEARGGFGPITGTRVRPGWRDAVAVVVVGALSAAVFLL